MLVPDFLRPGAPLPPQKKCSRCTFWRSNHNPSGGTVPGLCHRFPKVEEKNSDEWCGEFYTKASVSTRGDG